MEEEPHRNGRATRRDNDRHRRSDRNKPGLPTRRALLGCATGLSIVQMRRLARLRGWSWREPPIV